MNMPYLNEIASTRELIDTFGGYNHNLSIGSGELFDMRNLCGDHYPILSTRPPRGLYATPSWSQGMISKDELCYIDGGDMVIGEARYPMALSGGEKPKTMISMGAYVIILPDKKYINTADPADRGDIEATVVSTDHTVISLCRADASEYGEIPTGVTPPRKSRGDGSVDRHGRGTPHAEAIRCRRRQMGDGERYLSQDQLPRSRRALRGR